MRLLLQKRQQCCEKDIIFNIHFHEVITDRKNVIMTYEFRFAGKTYVLQKN